MKNTITIADVMFSKEFETESGFKTQLVNLNIVEKLLQFVKGEDDEKEQIEKRQLALRLSDFTRLLVLHPMLALVDEQELNLDQKKLPKEEQLLIQYKNQIKLLKGAKLSIEREEIEQTMFDESKPKLDAKGKQVVGEDGEPVFEVLVDENGKTVKKLVGFGEIKFLKLELTMPAEKLAEKMVYGV